MRPLATTISVTGGFDLEEFYSQESGMPELAHGEVVLVSLSTADGQVIAHGQGEVEIAFASKVVEGRKIPIRKQKVKL